MEMNILPNYVWNQSAPWFLSQLVSWAAKKVWKCIDVRVGILLILKQQTTDKRYPTVCCQCQAIENVATVQNVKVHKKSSAHCMIWNFSPKSFSRQRCQLRLYKSLCLLYYGAMAKQNLGTSSQDSVSLLSIVFHEHFCISWYPCIYFRLLYMLKGCDIFVCLQLWRRQTRVGTANILDKAALVARRGLHHHHHLIHSSHLNHIEPFFF